MTEIVALIGFGEAGGHIGRGLVAANAIPVRAYDIRFVGADAPHLLDKAKAAGVAAHGEPGAAKAVSQRLNALAMKSEAVGEAIGQASANKMLRSIMIKGIEALLIESLVAARRAGIEERILDSVAETSPGIDWREAAAYYMGRTAIHGARRVTEMKEAAETLQELDLDPLMADAIASRIEWAYERLKGHKWADGEPRTYGEILDVIEGAPKQRSKH